MPEVHNYSLISQLQNSIKKRFEDLIELLHDELSDIKGSEKKDNRLVRILMKIKETENSLQDLKIEEKYKNIIVEEFVLYREKFEKEFSELDKVIKQGRTEGGGFNFKIKNTNMKILNFFIIVLERTGYFLTILKLEN